MYYYRERRSISAGAIFYAVFFIFIFIGCGVLLYIDKGLFWDWLPLISIFSAILNLILLITYFIKKNISGYVFTAFFLIFLTGIVLSSLFGPFALNYKSRDAYDEKRYIDAVNGFKTIFEEYPNSRYAKEISKDIAYTYYLANDFENALKYFNVAVDKKLIDTKALETNKLLSEIYAKLGDKYNREKRFSDSAENYIKAAAYFEFILSNFPDTNEAFIAKYKIPEYTYLAAMGYKTAGLFDNAIDAFEKISNNY